MSENIRQNRLSTLEYFDAYICLHINLNKFSKSSSYSIWKHEKSDKLEQRDSNYVQLINGLKSKFKMEAHLCQIDMETNQITAVLFMLLSRI